MAEDPRSLLVISIRFDIDTSPFESDNPSLDWQAGRASVGDKQCTLSAPTEPLHPQAVVVQFEFPEVLTSPETGGTMKSCLKK